ncbi:uncharacterized protein Tco025E_05475 [Trypanosoma conorhini]|uniref:Uncharacterized protein n=1 Tax=Trypanosoma conorhini TaxID=83891 RepID=A0A3R7L3K0_9TRYP|nr:uncharacterized protein Tco025E_05475 [Trypanosoma conorhini]RNF15611.1 hypothetical protein Tco025E_05475 [Trypanosoma conorhini]
MQPGGSAHLRRRVSAVGLAAAAARYWLPPCLTPPRQFHGRTGRGDLFFVNADARRHNGRTLGQLRGLRHGSQATSPESGQLHYKKLMSDAVGEAARSGSEQYRHAACTWSYLLPSLLRCAELAVAEKLWSKLSRLELNAKKEEAALLTGREKQSVQSGQDLFRYELHQRLPLLEESVFSAELHELVSWFTVARRAWVRLPTTSPSHSADISADDLALMERAFLPSRDVFSAVAAPTAFRDTTPESCQTYDMALRVARLTDVVIVRVSEEMLRLANAEGVGEGGRKSARLIAKEKMMRQRLVDELCWHGIPYQAVVSSNEMEGGDGEGARPCNAPTAPASAPSAETGAEHHTSTERKERKCVPV